MSASEGVHQPVSVPPGTADPRQSGLGRTLVRAFQQVQVIVDALAEGIMVRDSQGQLLTYNRTAEHLLGIRLQPCLGRRDLGPIRLLKEGGGDMDVGELPALECLRTGQEVIRTVFGVAAGPGVRWLEMNSAAIRPEGSREAAGVVSSFWDVSERKRQLDHLLEAATHDPLTALPNRRAFDAKLARVLNSARRRSRPVSLCLCDLDRFKQVNDALGHPAGDGLLRQFSDLLKDTLRGDDFPARLGGDEFAILFDGTPAAQARKVLERIQGRIQFRLATGMAPVTGSFGVADWCPGMSPEALLEVADQALYRTKGQGGDGVHVAEALGGTPDRWERPAFAGIGGLREPADLHGDVGLG